MIFMLFFLFNLHFFASEFLSQMSLSIAPFFAAFNKRGTSGKYDAQ